MVKRFSALDFNYLMETSRIGLYLLILFSSVVSYVGQNNFINWVSLSHFYVFLSIGFALHLYILSRIQIVFLNEKLLLSSFLADSFILNVLIGLSGQNQSFLLFLLLINILISGLLLRTQGSLVVALSTALMFSLATLLGVEIHSAGFLLVIGLNNLSFLAVAGLSGYLSDQLNIVDKELEKTGVSLESLQILNSMIVENIPSALVTFSEQGEVIQTNAQFERMMSLWANPKSFGKRNFFELFNIQSEEIILKLNGKKNFTYEEKVKSDESEFVYKFNVSKFYSPIYKNDLFIALIEDLTQIRKMEYSLMQSEKMAAVGQLAAGIAHEIRNPLAGISGSIEMLSQTTSNDDDKKLMKIILREIDRLNNLITEFLDYSKPEKPPTDSIDLSFLMNEVMESLKLNSKIRQDVEVIKDIESSVSILGRSEKIKQALLNIVINAYQSMDGIEKPELKITLKKEDQEVVLKIKDTGCGMDEKTRLKMFEPFHTTKAKGTGLGLAVTHKIIEGHKAQVFVESEKGKGTEFILKFPKLDKI